GQGANDYAGGQGLAGVFGVREGQGARLSARVVDDAVAGPPRTREGAGRGARMSCRSGPGHGVQDSWSRGSQAAQGAVLFGTSRRRVRAKDGEGSVRLSRGPTPEKAAKSKKPRKPVAVVSYDEKPGIQAIATTAPDLPPEPGVHPTFARDHEYKRHGT